MGKIEDGIYYGSNGEPAHRGIIKIDNKIYYAGENGVIVKDCRKTIHHGMGNGVMRHGSYYFDANGVCDLNSFQEVKRKKGKGKKHKSKSHKERVLAILLSCFVGAIILSLAAITVFTKYFNKPSAEAFESQVTPNGTIEITLSEFEDEVYLCTPEMQKYYQGEYTLQEVVESGATAYQPPVFDYTISNADTATLLISENDDYSDGTKYDLDITSNSISVDNLKTDTTYYYLVTAEAANGTSSSRGGSFKTADTNRFISFDGVYNTRDIGGYNTTYGKKIKQGVLIRGTELDGMGEIDWDSVYILENSEAVIPFGFVCELDLRSEVSFSQKYKSRLGNDVVHLTYGTQAAYGEIFTDSGKQLMKQIFTDLSDPNNYPMYLHCTYGADRTGTVIFLLQGLLGVSKEDIMDEFHLTGFFLNGFESNDRLNGIFGRLDEYDGKTINDKIENYMTDIGITEAQIQSIRDIFLG